MEIKYEVVGPITLTTPIGERRVYDADAEGYVEEPFTLGQEIARQIFVELRHSDGFRTLASEVTKFRHEEIQAQLKPLIEKAIAAPVQRTNAYGTPLGEQTTLVELVLEETKQFLNRRDDSYHSKDKRTYVEQLVAAAVSKAVKDELAEVIAVEKAKVVAAMKERAAEVIAEALKAGMGR